MSEQAKIIEDMQKIVMSILEKGSATIEEADEIDRLEELLHEQKCYNRVNDTDNRYQGEEIATLFFSDDYNGAIDKMIECGITPDDFFGFVEYHYDDEHEDYESIKMFTNTFISSVNEAYQSKSTSV